MDDPERSGPGPRPVRNRIADELSRRELLRQGGALGLGAAVLAAMPYAELLARPAAGLAQDPNLADATLAAFFDTIIPGRKAQRTDLGHSIHPLSIAGVDPDPGAVEADAVLLSHHPKIGFDVLEPAFLADLESRALAQGGHFLDLDYDARERAVIGGLDFSNPARVTYEAAAAIPFTAFCAAATQREPTWRTASGYRVMRHPGTAPNGYRSFSYRRKLAKERTKKGYLP